MTSLGGLAPLAAALLVAVPRLRPAVVSLAPLFAVPALVAVFLPSDALAAPARTVPALDAGLDPVGRVFLGFASALWSAIWPLVIGGVLAALAHRLRDRLRFDASVPAGDVVPPLGRVARLVLRVVHAGAAAGDALRVDPAPLREAAAGAASAALRAERSLRRWRVGGTSLLVVAAAVLLALALDARSHDVPSQRGRPDAETALPAHAR